MNLYAEWFSVLRVGGNYNTMHIYAGNGGDTFDINFAGGYIDKSHVKALVSNGDILTLQFYSESRVKTSRPVLVGENILLYRDTPKVVPIAQFADGALLTADNLDRNAKQAVFVAAEMLDRFDTFGSSLETSVEQVSEALRIASEAVEIAKGIDGKATYAIDTAEGALDKSLSAIAKSEQALTEAHSAKGVADSAVYKLDEHSIAFVNALRRLYGESGFKVVGTFKDGFTIVNSNDIAIDTVTGKGYSGTAGTYPAGTSTAGFIDKSEELLFVTVRGTVTSDRFQRLVDSAKDSGKSLLAMCSVDAVGSVDLKCKLHPASRVLVTPRLVAPAVLWPDGDFVVKNSYSGEQSGLEVNNTNYVNGSTGVSLIGYLADSPESTHIRIVAKRFPVNIQCRNYSNRFVDCTGRLGGTGISAVGTSSSKEINALVIDGGDYTDNADHNMFIGDTRFNTTIADSDYMGLGVSVVNMPRVDQGGIKVDRVNSVKLNAYFEKAGNRYPVAIEIGGNKPGTRLKDYQIAGCVVRNYNYFVKANQRVDGLVIKPNDLYSVDYSGCYLSEIGSGFVYDEQTKTGAASMVRGQEVHTGVPSGLGAFDPFRSCTIAPHGIFGGIQIHVKDTNNSDRPDFVTGSQLIVGTVDRLLRHYRNSKRCRISTGVPVPCAVSGNKATLPLTDVVKFNGGDLVTIGEVRTYVTNVDYATGVVTTDAQIEGHTIAHTAVAPTLSGASGVAPTEIAAPGSVVYNSSGVTPVGWRFIGDVWTPF